MARCIRSSFVGAAALATIWSDASAFRKMRESKAARHMAGIPVYMAEQSISLSEEWMVGFGPSATDATLEAFCAQSGPCNDMGHPDGGGIAYVALDSTEEALEKNIEAFRDQVTFVEQDALQMDFGRLEDTLRRKDGYRGPSNLGQVGVPYAKSTGKGVNVYVLDTGVRVRHQEFGGRAIPLLDARTKPAKLCDPKSTQCARDWNGHGTHVAGIVGGKTYGVAPESTIWGIYKGRSMSDGFGCIDWLASYEHTKRPAVLQMSFGQMMTSKVAEAAVDAAIAAKITVVAASGNNNLDACGFCFAYIPKLISVGAVDINYNRASFSNFGSCVDIFAPGVQIKSMDMENNTATKQATGTSQAAPHVSGAAALVLELNPAMSPAEVKQELLATAAPDMVKDAQGSRNLFLKVGEAPPPTEAPEVPEARSGLKQLAKLLQRSREG